MNRTSVMEAMVKSCYSLIAKKNDLSLEYGDVKKFLIDLKAAGEEAGPKHGDTPELAYDAALAYVLSEVINDFKESIKYDRDVHNLEDNLKKITKLNGFELGSHYVYPNDIKGADLDYFLEEFDPADPFTNKTTVEICGDDFPNVIYLDTVDEKHLNDENDAIEAGFGTKPQVHWYIDYSVSHVEMVNGKSQFEVKIGQWGEMKSYLSYFTIVTLNGPRKNNPNYHSFFKLDDDRIAYAFITPGFNVVSYDSCILEGKNINYMKAYLLEVYKIPEDVVNQIFEK